MFRATTQPKGAIEVLDGVYLSMSQELLRELLARDKPVEGLRVYAGYAGWAPGQLEFEISRGDWHLAQADAQTIFAQDPELLWPKLFQRASAKTARNDSPFRPVAAEPGAQTLCIDAQTPVLLPATPGAVPH
jgi:putative transcriptional regulator